MIVEGLDALERAGVICQEWFRAEEAIMERPCDNESCSIEPVQIIRMPYMFSSPMDYLSSECSAMLCLNLVKCDRTTPSC